MLHALLFLLVAGPPTVATVTTNADVIDPNDGLCSLREAVLMANGAAPSATGGECPANPSIINLPAGTFTLSITGAGEDAAATGDLDISQSVSIVGAGQDQTIIDGNDSDRIFDSNSTITLTLTDLTLQHGHPPSGDGGAVRMVSFSGELEFVRVTLTENSAGAGADAATLAGQGGNGGAIFASDTQLILTDCVVSLNTSGRGGKDTDGSAGTDAGPAGDGGGIWADSSIFTFTHVKVEGNAIGGAGPGGPSPGDSAQNGGNGAGIYFLGGAVTISESTFSSNSASHGPGAGLHMGGALFAADTFLDVTTCTFNNNRADRGGAIEDTGINAAPATQELHFSASTVFKNTAFVGGGGIDFSLASGNATSPFIFEATFVGNVGGALVGGNGPGEMDVLSNLIVGNADVDGSTPLDCANLPPIKSFGGDLWGAGTGCSATTSLGPDNTTSLPVVQIVSTALQNVQGGLTEVLLLPDGSPALGTGECFSAQFDQVGTPFFGTGTCDVGAIEMVPGPFLTEASTQPGDANCPGAANETVLAQGNDRNQNGVLDGAEGTLSYVCDGANGSNGPKGAAGANGTNGAAGATGAAGVRGSTGAPGTDGVAGPAGAAGSAGTIASIDALPQGTAGKGGCAATGNASALVLAAVVFFLRRKKSSVFLAVLFCASPLNAAEIDVNATADLVANDGNCTLREAITAANTMTAVDACSAGDGNDNIVLPAGTYFIELASTGEDNNLDGDFDILNNLTITGAGTDVTTVDGDSVDRVFDIINNTRVEFDALTITHGMVPSTGAEQGGDGGGIRNSGQLVLQQVVISENSAGAGTGLLGNGGGVAVQSGASVEAVDVFFNGNQAEFGGGVFTRDGSFLRVVFADNAADQGGGIFGGINGLSVSNATFVSNQAVKGAAIEYDAASTAAMLTNCTVFGNADVAAAAAIDSTNSQMDIQSSTIAANQGAGVSLQGAGALSIRSSIVIGNTTADCGSGVTSADYNVTGIGCPSNQPHDQTSNAPPAVVSAALTPDALAVLPLAIHSIAFGTGACTDVNGDAIRTDEQGTLRTPPCDVGAMEVNVNASAVTIATIGPGADCASGGQQINVGDDSNQDGVVEDLEASSITFVCNGAPGAADNTPGAAGAAGNDGAAGVAGSAGASGAVGANGTDGTTGPNGETGANGTNAIATSTALAAGSACPNGGFTITSGIDTNDNGVLDASEVKNTNVVCNGKGKGCHSTEPDAVAVFAICLLGLWSFSRKRVRFVVLCLFFAAPLYANEIDVTSTDDVVATDGNCTLREAINAATTQSAVDACAAGSGDDNIVLPAGTYTIALASTVEDDNADGDFDIATNISFTGASTATTIIDGAQLDRVFDFFNPAVVTFSNLTIQHGRVPMPAFNRAGDFGGGVRDTSSGALTFTNVNLSHNAAAPASSGGVGGLPGGDGGAIFVSSALTMTHCTVDHNAAGDGDTPLPGFDNGGDGGNGGGVAAFGSTLLDHVAFIANTAGNFGLGDFGNGAAGFGGGIYQETGSLNLVGCEIDNNISPGSQGGGLYSLVGTQVATSTFTGNQATRGAAVYVAATSAGFTNSTFFNNTSSDRDALWFDGGVVSIASCTIVGNVGSGVMSADGNTTNVQSSILARNTGDCQSLAGGSVQSQGHNLLGANCNLFTADQIESDPSTLVQAALSDAGGVGNITQVLLLTPDSDAHGAGLCTSTHDERGALRRTPCDAGAVETYVGGALYVASDAGGACDNGGQRIDFGNDADFDGALEASEISRSTLACAGDDGNPGVDGSPGNAGSNGSDGAAGAAGAAGSKGPPGTAGVAGAPGSDGAAGPNALVTQTVISAGSVCANGGVTVATGVDSNSDGVLEAGEVLKTQNLCNGAAAKGCNASGGGSAWLALAALVIWRLRRARD